MRLASLNPAQCENAHHKRRDINAWVSKHKKQLDKHKGYVPLKNNLQVGAWEQKAAARSRSMPRTLDRQSLINNSMALDCNEKWKQPRKVCKSKLIKLSGLSRQQDVSLKKC